MNDDAVRKTLDKMQAADQAGDHRLADAIPRVTDDGDAQLNTIDDLIQTLGSALDNARADTSGFNELLDASIANAHQRELGGCEKRIGCHQEQGGGGAEQHKGDQWNGNSNI